jgi:hypothetical protein
MVESRRFGIREIDHQQFGLHEDRSKELLEKVGITLGGDTVQLPIIEEKIGDNGIIRREVLAKKIPTSEK